jgi:hypothetical protein
MILLPNFTTGKTQQKVFAICATLQQLLALALIIQTPFLVLLVSITKRQPLVVFQSVELANIPISCQKSAFLATETVLIAQAPLPTTVLRVQIQPSSCRLEHA